MPLDKRSTIGTWIKDFKKSDAPQFKGKSPEKRRDMAIAAYLNKESVDLDETTAGRIGGLTRMAANAKRKRDMETVDKVSAERDAMRVRSQMAAKATRNAEISARHAAARNDANRKSLNMSEASKLVGTMTGKGFNWAPGEKRKSKLPSHLKDLGTIRKAFSNTRNNIKKKDKIGIGENISDLSYDADIHSDGKMKVKKMGKDIHLHGRSYHSADAHAKVAKKMGMKISNHTKTTGGTRSTLTTEAVTTGNEPGMMFKVEVEGLPDMIMVGRSPSDIKQQLRKIVKQPSMILDVNRMPKSQVRKMYRNLAGGKDIDESTIEFGKSIDKINKKKRDAMATPSEKDKVNKIRQMLAKEKPPQSEENQPEWGTPESAKKAKDCTPGQKAEASALDRVFKALKTKEKMFPGSTYLNVTNTSPYAKNKDGNVSIPKNNKKLASSNKS